MMKSDIIIYIKNKISIHKYEKILNYDRFFKNIFL